MNKYIKNLDISPMAKSTLSNLGITEISQLENHTYLTLSKMFPKCYNLYQIVKELNALGYLLPPENEISIYEITLSIRLRNILIRNQIFYLSQLSDYPRERILHFRNLGPKTMSELEELCQKYNIKISSLNCVKDSFRQYKFSSTLYENFFKYHLFSIEDFKQISAHDLYFICREEYLLTMKTYSILKKNNIILKHWEDLYLFEFLSMQKSRTLWLKYHITTLKQLGTALENIPNLSKYFPASSKNELAELLDKYNCSDKR